MDVHAEAKGDAHGVITCSTMWPAFARGIGVPRKRGLAFEPPVALDAKAAGAAETLQFAKAHATEFGEAMTQIAKSVQKVGIVWICLAYEPGGRAGRIEKFDDGRKIALGLRAFDLGLFAAIGEQLFAQFFGEKFHGCLQM